MTGLPRLAMRERSDEIGIELSAERDLEDQMCMLFMRACVHLN